MASLNTNVLHHAPSLLKSLGQWLTQIMVQLAEFSPTYRAIEYYNALSDEQLAEMGMTRQDVVEKVFARRSYL